MRIGSNTAWSFGDDAASAGAYMRHLQADKGLNSYTGAQAVGTKKPNEFGLHNNVEEMCADFWSADYYAKSPPEDPTGPYVDLDKTQPTNPYKSKSSSGDRGKSHDKFKHHDKGRPAPSSGQPTAKDKQPESSKDKVARGGSFMEVPQAGRSAFRDSLNPALGHVQLGFRVLCEISLPE
jgi:formylglycine-generating enzyme required for sulfatase activity